MSRRIVTTTLFLVLAMAATAASAEEVAVAGRFTGEYAQQLELSVPGAQGHRMMLTEARGTNTSRAGDFMDGASIVNRTFTDLVQGNGSHRGYVTMDDGDSRTLAEWSGRVETSIREGRPFITFSGDWRMLHATGAYRGVSGVGTYRGHFTAEDAYVVDYQGVIDVP